MIRFLMRSAWAEIGKKWSGRVLELLACSHLHLAAIQLSFDCDPCQAFTYDCTACIAAGCNYCPGDGICLSKALDESFWQLYPEKTTSCPTSDDWKDTCEKREDNSHLDPLYETMLWSYRLINVEQSWNRGANGKDIHVSLLELFFAAVWTTWPDYSAACLTFFRYESTTMG